MRHFKARIKERGRDTVLTPEYLGDDNTDKVFLIKFWGLEEPDVEWYEIEEVEDGKTDQV